MEVEFVWWGCGWCANPFSCETQHNFCTPPHHHPPKLNFHHKEPQINLWCCLNNNINIKDNNNNKNKNNKNKNNNNNDNNNNKSTIKYNIQQLMEFTNPLPPPLVPPGAFHPTIILQEKYLLQEIRNTLNKQKQKKICHEHTFSNRLTGQTLAEKPWFRS